MYDTQEFQNLRREYLTNALERCDYLESESARLRSGEAVDLKALRQEVHKFRGSGGFYGFAALSAAAGQAEDTLILTLDDEIPRNDSQIASLVAAVVAAAREAAKEFGL